MRWLGWQGRKKGEGAVYCCSDVYFYLSSTAKHWLHKIHFFVECAAISRAVAASSGDCTCLHDFATFLRQVPSRARRQNDTLKCVSCNFVVESSSLNLGFLCTKEYCADSCIFCQKISKLNLFSKCGFPGSQHNNRNKQYNCFTHSLSKISVWNSECSRLDTRILFCKLTERFSIFFQQNKIHCSVKEN